MEPRAHHILIGVFTLIVAIAAIFFSLWLAKTGNDNKTKEYTVVFTEAVHGLNRGSAVQYNGIRIGEVTQLALDPQDIRRVLVSVSIQNSIPVKENTHARLALTGITGTSVIALTGGTPDSPELKPQFDGFPPIIMASPSPLSTIMAGGEELMTSVSELLINANAFLSSDNADRIGNSITQLERLLAQLANGSESLPQVLNTFNGAGKEVEGLLKEVRVLVANEGGNTLSKANQVMQNLANSTQELQRILAANAPAIQQGSQGFSQLGPLMQDLREVLTNINNISQELQHNPTQYLLGTENLQEFQP